VLRQIGDYEMVVVEEWYDVLPFKIAGKETVDEYDCCWG